MQCNIETYRGVTIVTPMCEHLDATNYKILQEAMGDSLLSANDLLLDMGAVTFIDSTGVGELLVIRKKVHALEGKFRICDVTESVKKSFELVHLDSVIPLYETRQLALSEPGRS